MPSAGETEPQDPYLLPGQILLIRNIDDVLAFKPPPLCKIAGDALVPVDQRSACLGKNKRTGYSVFLERGPHEWLAARKWNYYIFKCPKGRSIILELEELNRAVMFKLTWAGLEKIKGV